MLLNLISLGVRVSHPLQMDDALDSLDDHLKIKEESRPYEVMVIYLSIYISLYPETKIPICRYFDFKLKSTCVDRNQ